MGNPLIPKAAVNVKTVDMPHSAGILDDFAVRKDIQTKTITAQNVTADEINVPAGGKVYIAPTSYFIYEGGKVVLYVNGVKRQSWA